MAAREATPEVMLRGSGMTTKLETWPLEEVTGKYEEYSQPDS
jgi:hypothetical protein